MDTFPLCSFPPLQRRPMLAGLTVESGPAVVGPGQTTDWSGGGWWMLTLGGMSLRTPSQRRLWQAMMMRLNGGAEEIVVPFPFSDLAPWPGGQPQGRLLTAHSDGSTFSDTALYSQSALGYELALAVADGDTSARVSRLNGGDIQGGEFFTLDHATAGPRVYCIEGVAPVDGRADLFDIDFGPPARDPAAAGAVADFQNPRCVMKLINAADSWPTREHRTATPAQATFCESFDYLDPS